MRACADEDGFALRFKLGQWRIGIRQGHGAGVDGISERPHPRIGEQGQLKGCEVVKQLLRRQAVDLRMTDEGTHRLLLQCGKASI